MKQRITSKMRRELKRAVNPLEELLIIIKQYFPKLTNWIDNFNIADEFYKYQNEIIYGEPDENKKYYTVNVISYDEEQIDEETTEIIIKNFSYITSLEIQNDNKENIILIT